MIDVIGKAFFNPKVNRGLTWLNDPNSNVKLVVNDLGTSSGRIYQEYERSPHGGRESLIEEVTTTAIWGGGIPLGKKLVDWAASKSGKNLQLPNMDLRLFNKDNPQRLDKETIDYYFKHSNKTTDQAKAAGEAAKTMLMKMAEDGNEEAIKTGKALLNKNRMFQFAKVSGVGLTASVILGFGVPKLNQHITKLFLENEKKKRETAKPGTPNKPAALPLPVPPMGAGNGFGYVTFPAANMAVNPFSAAAGAVSYGNYANGFSAFAGAGKKPVTGQQNVRFGSMGTMGSHVLQKLQENDQLGTMIFSDFPLSSGRVVTARNKDERIEKLFKEAGIILTLFVIQQNLEAKLAGSANHLGYPALMKLSQTFGPGKPGNLLEEYKHVKSQLGVKEGKLGEYFENAKAKPELMKKQVTHIREYFDTIHNPKAYQQKNLLLDMAEAGGKIPTIKAVKDGVRSHIDITKEIDMEGVKSMAHYLDKLVEQGDGAIQRQLSKTALHKAGAFMGSMLVGSAIMSYAIPKIQHYITYKRTGKDYFPGVQDNDIVPAAVKPAMPMPQPVVVA